MRACVCVCSLSKVSPYFIEKTLLLPVSFRRPNGASRFVTGLSSLFLREMLLLSASHSWEANALHLLLHFIFTGLFIVTYLSLDGLSVKTHPSF